MKLILLFLILAVPIAFGGELADQFSKKPHKRTFLTTDFDRDRVTEYGINEIGIEHTPCFGTCPVFTAIINSNGTFRYHGEKYVKRRGNWHGNVSDIGRLDFILRYVAGMKFFDLYDEYLSHDSDLPGTYTMVVTRARRKIVYNYGGVGPAKLGALDDLIDRLFEGAEWRRD